MERRISLVTYIPVGESDRIDYVSDTIESIHHHCPKDTVVIIMDDSGPKMHGETLQKLYPFLLVHKTEPRYQGKGLAGRHAYETVRLLKFAVDHCWFDTILRVDTDALITGDDIHIPLKEIFDRYTSVGMIGRYWINAEGYRIDRGESDHLFARIMRFPRRYAFFFGVNRFKKIIKRAQGNGYIYGELVLGCSTAYSYECAFRLAKFINDFKPLRCIRGLAEDYFTTVFVKYVNMDLGNACHPEGPMAVDLKGIPIELENVVLKNKKIIHSIKNDPRYTQDEIRAYFRHIRLGQTKPRPAAESFVSLN